MNEEWTAEIAGTMHKYKITTTALSAEIGWTRSYLSQVLNCHETPKGAEEKIREALGKMIRKKTAN